MLTPHSQQNQARTPSTTLPLISFHLRCWRYASNVLPLIQWELQHTMGSLGFQQHRSMVYHWKIALTSGGWVACVEDLHRMALHQIRLSHPQVFLQNLATGVQPPPSPYMRTSHPRTFNLKFLLSTASHSVPLPKWRKNCVVQFTELNWSHDVLL